jgi:protein-tyrosine phosphatase
MTAPGSGVVPARFSVLTVCTGNLARSPISAQLLAARTRQIPAVVVTSAGTRAHEGDPMTTQAADISLRYGGEPAGHRATELTAGEIAGADLVLTATRQHRAAAVTLVPRAARYTFTLRQFARLVSSLDLAEVAPSEPSPTGQFTDVDCLKALVAAAASHRGFLPPLANPDDDDIEDPFRQSQTVYDRVGALIDGDVTTIASAFATVVDRAGTGARAPR